ncbi:ATP-binding protein [Pedobacter antarcticus]|uniref:ATP-binding protein n=1 Tax=Pedobacter antarcticus TaxID=34086 RepID=UPI00088EBC60|nr:ATP-binding protein [Pedobacter antarcticus]SDM84085.1 CBS domain-containing protein [Pedobacter antarcticus]
MKINNLIDRNYKSASVLEDTRDISIWLREFEYLAVMDEDLKIIGIVTLKDIHSNPDSRAVIDIDYSKPQIHSDQTILEVLAIMKNSQSDFLPVYEDNNFIGVISLLNITERLALLLNEKQQDYQRAIHDLRNPVSNIYGLTNILEVALDDKENQELIQLCTFSCKHALDILDDLLFVEMDENRPLHKSSTELNSFYKQCIIEQLGLSLLKQIKVTTDFCASEIFREIDRNQLKRAIQNVFSNAVKFSYPNSDIKVSTKIEGEKFILKIVDSGIGIPINLQPEIFKKFTIAQRKGTNGEASTGLGLCFTKQCIEQHEGNIYFKSFEGKGTKFYIEL